MSPAPTAPMADTGDPAMADEDVAHHEQMSIPSPSVAVSGSDGLGSAGSGPNGRRRRQVAGRGTRTRPPRG